MTSLPEGHFTAERAENAEILAFFRSGMFGAYLEIFGSALSPFSAVKGFCSRVNHEIIQKLKRVRR